MSLTAKVKFILQKKKVIGKHCEDILEKLVHGKIFLEKGVYSYADHQEDK